LEWTIDVAIVQAVDDSMQGPIQGSSTNVIAAGFGERCNLVTEGKMFVKDKAKISSKVGGVK